MKIEIGKKVKKYMKQEGIRALLVENQPGGCSCVGIHLHLGADYLLEDLPEEKKDKFEVHSLDDILVYVDKEVLPLEEVKILGTFNPFNKKVYLHCE